RDGIILFGTSSKGIYRIAAAGGSPEPVTTLDRTRGEISHRSPVFLPDGRHFLYRSVPSNTIWLGSLDQTPSARLVNADSQAVFASGWLLFVRQGALMAQRFDLSRGVANGEPVRVVEQVPVDSLGTAAFSVSAGGVLVYRTGAIGLETRLT